RFSGTGGCDQRNRLAEPAAQFGATQDLQSLVTLVITALDRIEIQRRRIVRFSHRALTRTAGLRQDRAGRHARTDTRSRQRTGSAPSEPRLWFRRPTFQPADARGNKVRVKTIRSTSAMTRIA